MVQTLTNRTVTNQTTLPRIGAVSAILGAVVQVGAGIESSSGFGTVMSITIRDGREYVTT